MFPIIDSHIHLYSSKDIPSLNWQAELQNIPCLNRENSLKEYRAATSASSSICGFIYVETDRKSGLEDNQWDHVLDEVSFLSRIANGEPQPGESFERVDKDLLLGIVPWAPIAAGSAALSRYMTLVKERCNGTAAFSKIKGVRYLLQDKPPGTMLQQEFIEGVKWLGQNNLTFDLGVDARSGGIHQLKEACQLLMQVGHAVKMNVIINHLCKPNLRLSASEARGGHPDFAEWKECIAVFSSINNTYMKLSGAFSELPPQQEGEPADISQIVTQLRPWADSIFQIFGPERIMFGSDWPVCNVGGPGTEMSWKHWHDVVAAILDDQDLTDDEKRMVWSGTAARAYDISLT